MVSEHRTFFPRPPFTRIGATTTFILSSCGTLKPHPPKGHSVIRGLWR